MVRPNLRARPTHQRLIRIIPALPRCTTGLVFPYFDGRASVPLADIRRPRDTSIWKLEAALKCRWCKKGRYAPPVHMIKLTETREITPYIWVHPDEKTDEPW